MLRFLSTKRRAGRYPVEDAPGGTVVSAKLLNSNTVELTSRRNGQVVAINPMSVAPGGKSIHVIVKNGEGETVTTRVER